MERRNEEVRRTPIRFKSRGRYKGTREVTPFAGGNWKTWLEFQREIQRLYQFLDMSDSDRSARGLREIIGQLLQGQDLDLFFTRVAAERDDGRTVANAIVGAMDSITAKYCPVGTRDELHEEIKGLHKARSMTVAEYSTKFEDLIALERWILPDDGTAMSQAEQCRHFSAGMPRHWQMQVVPQQERWTDRRLLQERYLQCERVDQRPNKEPFEKGKKRTQEKTRRKEKANARENRKRVEHEYRPDDQVMIARNDARAPKLQQAYEGPFRILSVRSDGILVIDRIRYQESIHMRRAKPFCPTTMGEL